MPRQYTPQLPFTCLRCGKVSFVKASHAPLKRYCSKACQENRQAVGCTVCGSPMSVQANRISLNNYCGSDCTKQGYKRSWAARNTECIPDAVTLRQLYEGERLSLRDIAIRFNVEHISVGRWFRKYGIPRRATGRGLAHRGKPEPIADDLRRFVHEEHRSYEEIAAVYGVDPSAVRHWLLKHGIPCPTAWGTRRKGNEPTLPNEEELRCLYGRGFSTDAIGQLYGVSGTPILNLCREFGITLRDSGWGGRPVCDDGHRVRSSYEFRVDNWLTQHGIAHTYEPTVPFDRRCRSDFLANGWYIEIWGVTNSRAYTERKERKQRLYRMNDLPLIELSPHAFDAAHAGLWERKLAQCLMPILRQVPLPLPQMTA